MFLYVISCTCFSFAPSSELQSDVTDLTAEIRDGKKPLYRYDDYTLKMLSPPKLDHVVLHPPIVSPLVLIVLL